MKLARMSKIHVGIVTMTFKGVLAGLILEGLLVHMGLMT
jgi:hypothetical protein